MRQILATRHSDMSAVFFGTSHLVAIQVREGRVPQVLVTEPNDKMRASYVHVKATFVHQQPS